MNDELEKEKAFTIKPAEDKDARIIIGAGRAVLRDPALKRCQGAKALFVLLLDLALDKFLNMGRRGQIVISTTKLCEELGASKRSIWGWKKLLVQQLHIWITKHPMPNTHPMDCFHITALQRGYVLDAISQRHFQRGDPPRSTPVLACRSGTVPHAKSGVAR